ncbi:MAG: hypothetical protein PHF70_06585 [Opitutales bacterium]|nr:hypothetical protein [Opitutales bacterium]
MNHFLQRGLHFGGFDELENDVNFKSTRVSCSIGEGEHHGFNSAIGALRGTANEQFQALCGRVSRHAGLIIGTMDRGTHEQMRVFISI